jgi:S1/P1 Nuclease
MNCVRWTCARILFSLFLFFLGCQSARAWRCKGHQTVARIAEKRLTPQARQFVEKLLVDNPADPQLKRYCGNATRDLMADASTWADDVRGTEKNGPWHYIDIPRGAPPRAAGAILSSSRFLPPTFPNGRLPVFMLTIGHGKAMTLLRRLSMPR